MKSLSRHLNSRFRKRLAAAILIGIIGLGWGWMLSKFTFGQSLRRASYDLPFLFREIPPPQDIVLVALDEASYGALDQPLAQPWDRRLHAKLVERLTASGARMIVFDILFHDDNAEEDPAFAGAIKAHGNVVHIGEIIRNGPDSRIQQSLLLATPSLRRAAAGWGLTDVPIDSDGSVRRIRHRIPTDLGEKPSLAGFVMKRLRGEEPSNGATFEFLNYYGPAGTFPSHSYSEVLLGQGIPENTFRNKIVIVGAIQKAGLADAGKDMFPTPYLLMPVTEGRGDRARKSRKLTSGMEIQATAIGNLIEDRRVTRMPDWLENLLIGMSAFAFAGLACLMPPVRGILSCVFLAAAIMFVAVFAQRDHGLYFIWAIPVFGQMPLVAGLALGGHYFIEYSGRWRLRRAFKAYLSDEQARQIDEDAVSLELGGKEVEVTILFSDLAGFTSMSEGLPPRALSDALIHYFERTTEGIFDNQGTILKYIGDAVMATWGAPVKVDREADRAIEAAIQMQLASEKPIPLETGGGLVEQVLETRIGINSGTVLAGNLGSRRRFDYTVIGDPVNIAARLEGLNKMLGTSILVTDAVLAKCVAPERFLKREVGSFVVKGKTRGIAVIEIFGTCDAPESAVRKRTPEYLEIYQQGLDACRRGDLAAATSCFSACLTLHDRLPECPAARLHLDAIEASPDDWRGEVVLDSK